MAKPMLTGWLSPIVEYVQKMLNAEAEMHIHTQIYRNRGIKRYVYINI